MQLLRSVGIGAWVLLVATGSAGMDVQAQVKPRAQLTRSIDWYLAHPDALQNAMVQCNVQNGLVGTQDCRNAMVAAHIVVTRPSGPGGTTNLP